MKKFQFRLEGVLKLRKFKEDKIKQEIGDVLRAIGDKKDQIVQIQQSIKDAYDDQDDLLKEPTASSMLKFFPYYIEGRKEDMVKKHDELSQLEAIYQVKLLELQKARGDVKVMDNMKEKKLKAHVKHNQKKLQEDIEDILNMKAANGQDN